MGLVRQVFGRFVVLLLENFGSCAIVAIEALTFFNTETNNFPHLLLHPF